MKGFKHAMFVIAVASILVLGACQLTTPAQAPATAPAQAPATEPASAEEATELPDEAPEGAAEKELIRFSDTQFQTLWINNAIAQFVIKRGYGYPVETTIVSTAIMKESLASGEVDVHMELWRMNNLDWYERVTSAGKVLDLGPTYEESTQGWYVPRYVIEGDAERGIEPMAPNLKSVFDLPQYKDLFQDPEDPDEGVLVSCIIGWHCAEVNRVKLHAYGLAGDYNLNEPGSAAALDATIVGAYEKGEPILAYYWEPTWLMGAYDLVQLEGPEWTEECKAEMTKVFSGEIEASEASEAAGCAFRSTGIHKGVHASLKDRAPEVVAFLKKMNVGTDPLNETAAYMENNDASAEEAALWFFENYQERWRGWVPENVEARVEKALIEAGADL